ncbi:MAG: DEAD/DEAH box helicase family protein, partial [Rhodospirillaceae bacterium]|nr:DEAD/DEAH box helicase family protein [Rhodospirillaceae bacterium]
MQKIYYVDAFCGAGKTYAAIKYALNIARCYKNILFVQPSIQLIKQSLQDCNDQLSGPPIQFKISAIHSENVPTGSVLSSVISHLNSSGDIGEILFITHETFSQLQYFNRINEWEVLIDEIPTVDQDLSLNLPDNHQIITDHLEVFSDHPVWYRIKTGDITTLTNLSENRKHDDVYAVFKNLVSNIISNHWDVYVKKSNWHKLLNGEQAQFGCFALLNPSVLSGFNKVTIMGAMFEKSLLHVLW